MEGPVPFGVDLFLQCGGDGDREARIFQGLGRLCGAVGLLVVDAGEDQGVRSGFPESVGGEYGVGQDGVVAGEGGGDGVGARGARSRGMWASDGEGTSGAVLLCAGSQARLLAEGARGGGERVCC